MFEDVQLPIRFTEEDKQTADNEASDAKDWLEENAGFQPHGDVF